MPTYATDRDALETACRVEFVRDSGPGGQHRNKRYTGVRLVHEPSGLVVMATERRSQSMNKALAFERMAEKLKAKQHKPKKRRATRPTRGSVKRRLESKSKVGQKKAGRRKPSDD
jgi:ribosome-associated protein